MTVTKSPLWYPYTQHKHMSLPFHIDGADGVYLTCDTGKQLIDGLVGNVVDSPSVEDNRIKAQASKKAKAQMMATYLKFKKD